MAGVDGAKTMPTSSSSNDGPGFGDVITDRDRRANHEIAR
jgi:hypothetical protein